MNAPGPCEDCEEQIRYLTAITFSCENHHVNEYLWDCHPAWNVYEAAPEMLEALERIGCQAPPFIQSTGGCANECYVCAVIAKAKGETK